MGPGPTLDVLAVGHAIMDRIGFVDDAVLTGSGLVKGSMRLACEAAELAVEGVGAPQWQWAAGSAANTAAGLALLGSDAGFVGRVGDDALGAAFVADMKGLGVEVHPPSPSGVRGEPTGQCLVLVTPDGERTMVTYLGASTSLSSADLPVDLPDRARVLYLEGYLWDSPGVPEAVERSLAGSPGPGPLVALSLSDPFCVQRHRSAFVRLIAEQVGLLFANEAEILALTESDDLAGAVATLRNWDCMVAITRGPGGSVVLSGGEATEVPAVRVDQVVDTTGAGDLYAAGFLHGFVAGSEPQLCARLGAVAAAEAISHVGARPMLSLRSLAEAAGLLPLGGSVGISASVRSEA